MKYILGICLLLTTLSANASLAMVGGAESFCYGKAMIGYDSVINARLDVKPDDQVKVYGYRTPREMDYLIVVLGAYLWTGSPHQYATGIFFDCAQKTK